MATARAQLLMDSNSSVYVGKVTPLSLSRNIGLNIGSNSLDSLGLYWEYETDSYINVNCAGSYPKIGFSHAEVLLKGNVLAKDFILDYRNEDIMTDLDYWPSRSFERTKNTPRRSLSSVLSESSTNIETQDMKSNFPSLFKKVGGKTYANYPAIVSAIAKGISNMDSIITQRSLRLEELQQSAASSSKASPVKSANKNMECRYDGVSKTYGISIKLPEGTSRAYLQVCDAKGNQTLFINTTGIANAKISADDVNGTTGYCNLIADGKLLSVQKISFQ